MHLIPYRGSSVHREITLHSEKKAENTQLFADDQIRLEFGDDELEQQFKLLANQFVCDVSNPNPKIRSDSKQNLFRGYYKEHRNR